VKCPQCHIEAARVGAFWVCPEHGQLPESRPTTTLRIFLSYGHDANEGLVRRIKADLERRRHDVWFDKSEIKFGDDWRRAITNGLIGSNRVLSFLSKHSTRDPGVCLDEIAIAIGVKGGNIQTILVESETEVQPPPSISHIQWLDMHDWRESHGVVHVEKDGSIVCDSAWEEWYQSKLAEIVRVVESDESRRFAGEIQTLSNYLKPISSDSRIAVLLRKGFIGRIWLVAAIEQWRSAAERATRLFWITGDPGVGKSAFAAHLTHFGRDKVIAAQFVEWDKPDHRNAQRVVRSLAFQLATRLPEYRKLLLTLPEISTLGLKNPSELFDYLIVNPLSTVIHGGRERVLIVIDALDEAGEGGRNPLVEMLARDASCLPDWIGLVVTSRPENAVTGLLQGLNPFVLNTRTDANRADIRDYLLHMLTSQLEGRPDADRLVEQILEKSEGVFLYVERACHDLEQGYLSFDRMDDFPQGLGGIFCQFFQRQFPEIERFRKDIRPAIRAILAGREPLPVEILQRVFNWQDEDLRDFTRTLGSLFPVTKESGTEVIKPYHKSLADWLRDKTLCGPYWCDVALGHAALAEICWEEYAGGVQAMSPYAAKHLPAHLAGAGRWDDLIAAVDDAGLGLLARWTEQGGHAEGSRLLEGMISHLDGKVRDPDHAACMMTQMARIHIQDGDYEDGKRWLQKALEKATWWRGRRARAIALHELGSLYLYEDDLPNTERCYRSAFRVCALGFPRFPDEAAANLLGLATLARRKSRHSKAKRLAQRALRKAIASGDVYHRISAHRAVAISLKDGLRYEEAERYLANAELASSLINAYRESLANHETRGWMSFERAWLEGTSQETAEDHFRQAIEEAERIGLTSCVAGARIGLAWCSVAKQDTASARDRCEEAERSLTRRQNRMLTTVLSVLRAGIALQSGDLETAQRLYREMIGVCCERNIPGEGSVAWSGLGATLWRGHKAVQAEDAWAHATRLAKRCSKARRHLTQIAINRARQSGGFVPY
jgi:tetratricopeptide (TPR) repeat protein